jgi:hypothetical protein
MRDETFGPVLSIMAFDRAGLKREAWWFVLRLARLRRRGIAEHPPRPVTRVSRHAATFR